ncbi:MAG TPA: purine-nucleoside phosphorylase [Gemmatimonadaceae bacterium]|jgi:purine-nucleoside phosphorylase|nr:purine-nucleoside phosphorylase [Gemmatimonadaceae bacterium]
MSGGGAYAVPAPPCPGGAAAAAAAEVLRGRLGVRAPVAGIVLGSGLGGLAHQLQHARRVPFEEVPGLPAAGVEGHEGALLAGTLAGREVLCLAGRFHLYEGHPRALAAYPVRLLHALGARTLIVSNAAGGVRRTLRPGDLMLIADHLDLQGRNPLVGAPQPGEARHPAMLDAYDPELRAELRTAALAGGVPVQEGVYAAVLGPSYETAAEVRLLERLGADAVGMSTVPEVVTARALGMRVAGVSCITNHACGIAPAPLDHADVLAVGATVSVRLATLVTALVARL